jgi:hypothetical protein
MPRLFRVMPCIMFSLRPLKDCVAQVSKPAVSPTSKSAGRGNYDRSADLEIRDTADLEVCATAITFFRGLSLLFFGPKSEPPIDTKMR